MADDDEETLARQGLKAAELLEPGAIRERVKESVAESAGEAALKGIAAFGRLTGRSPKRSPARQRAVAEVDIGPDLDAFVRDDLARFEQRVKQAAANKARETKPRDDDRRLDLAELRRSFPPESRELALLLFNCVDLLEELSADAEGSPPTARELERKEQLLERIGELLAPRASEALASFVAHVVETSRAYRTS